MKNIKIKISELKSNPFKKFINKGKLNEDIIDKLKEGFEQSRFHDNLCGRENNKGDIELIYGHHRAEAVKRHYGKDYVININVYSLNELSDEQMLRDMVRENLTQRDTDFHDTEDSVILAKHWLEGDKSGVKSLYTSQNKRGQERADKLYQGIGARQIATFLSKNGKTISHVQIAKYLNISNLDSDVHDKIAKGMQGHTPEGKIGLELGAKIAQFDNKDEQKDLYKASLQAMESGLSEEKVNKELTKYNNAPDEIKEQVREGELDLQDVEDAIFDRQIKESNKNKSSTVSELIPNFESRVKEFTMQVDRLESNVIMFKKVFGHKNFRQKYFSLPREKQKAVGNFIYTIRKRIKDCYDMVDVYASVLEENKQVVKK